MYIRKASYKYKEKTILNYQLVESHQTPKGPRQKVICSLGDLSPRSSEEWLKLANKVENALTSQLSLFDEKLDAETVSIVKKVRDRQAIDKQAPPVAVPKSVITTTHPDVEEVSDLVKVHADQVTIEQARQAGPTYVGHEFFKRLDMYENLENAGLSRPAVKLTCAMVLNRLIEPSAEHAMPAWFKTTAISDILGFDTDEITDDALYRNLDKLHPERRKIEKTLAERERSLFNLDDSIFLYDLTSTYFEGAALSNESAKRGYSRDKRPDCKQVLIGLALGREGFPVAHEIFDGNRRDHATVEDMLKALSERMGGIEGRTIVVDRGMAYEDCLTTIKSYKCHYIVASRQSERNEWLSEFEDGQGFEQIVRETSPWNEYQKKSKVQIMLKRRGDETLVLCISDGRREKDRAIREKHEQKFKADLKKIESGVLDGRLVEPEKVHQRIGRLRERYPRVARYYDIQYDEKNGFDFEVNHERMARAEKLDGSYILKTDRKDLTADDVWRIYMLLTRVENAFRNMKSPLAERPVFHQLKRRVETHVFLCVLALHILTAIEKTLLDRGRHTSWATVKEALSTHQVATVSLPTDKGMVLKIRRATKPEPEHLELYGLLDLTAQIVKPRKYFLRNDAPK